MDDTTTVIATGTKSPCALPQLPQPGLQTSEGHKQTHYTHTLPIQQWMEKYTFIHNINDLAL